MQVGTQRGQGRHYTPIRIARGTTLGIQWCASKLVDAIKTKKELVARRAAAEREALVAEQTRLHVLVTMRAERRAAERFIQDPGVDSELSELD